MRPLLLTGRVTRGRLVTSAPVEIVGLRDPVEAVVTGIESFRPTMAGCEADDNQEAGPRWRSSSGVRWPSTTG